MSFDDKAGGGPALKGVQDYVAILNEKYSEKALRYFKKVDMNLLVDKEEVLYPEWDFFVGMLDSPNSYWRLSAVRLLANLTGADKEKKFEKIFDQYYSLLDDSVIVAIYLVGDSGKIARAKPKLQTKITNKLLSIDKTQQKHKDLIKGSALLALSQYFEKVRNKKKIIDFAKPLLKGESPKTRKIAREFLSKWDKKG
ncbi:MAG: hypothetical protein GTO17_03045 [Candidatus Aminicenantes bacterium]|nr:hypothetical protein [Candidatus Aminicenantes bacterium]